MIDLAAELGSFLRSRRARLQPEEVGLVVRGNPRRVPGLRREELAQLAGVSITHYTRLEQGNAGNVSVEVPDAIATALRLTDHESAYLHRLARASRGRAKATETFTKLRPNLRDLLQQLVLTPAAIVGHHTDVVGYNRLCGEVLGPLPTTLTEGIFLDEELQARIAPSWETQAWHNVALLRTSLAKRPDDKRLLDHVATMREASPEFDKLWLQHDVVEWTYGEGDTIVDHPVVGRLELNFEHLVLPGDPHLYGLILWTAPPGSSSRAALESLAGIG